MMHTKQTIAIIGATGNMGSAMSKSLAKGNYRLLLKGSNQEALEKLVSDIEKQTPAADIETIHCSRNASWEADIIVVSAPYEAYQEIASKIRDVANQKIVISISNPVNSTYDGLLSNPETSAAEELQQMLPHSKVIKAFNTNFAADFYSPVIDGKQVDSFIAGNDPEALETVSELVRTTGFNPMIAGDLTMSRTLEMMQLMLIQISLKNNFNWLAGWKILH